MNYVLDLLREHIKIIGVKLHYAKHTRMSQKDVSKNRNILFSLSSSLELLEGTNKQALEMHRKFIEGTPMKDGLQPKGLVAFEEDMKS